MREKTIVIDTYEQASLERIQEQVIALEGVKADDKCYYYEEHAWIGRCREGRMRAVFGRENEPILYKITLTGLPPKTVFRLGDGVEEEQIMIANSAGILEFRYTAEPDRLVTLRQMR